MPHGNRKSDDQLRPQSVLVRDTVEKLGLSVKEFSDRLHYGYSTIRGYVSDNGNPCSTNFALALRTAIDESKDKEEKEILEELVAGLDGLCAKSKKIDKQRGLERRGNTSRHRSADVLVGPWTAVWQTSRDGREAILVESVDITKRKRGNHNFLMANRDDSRWLKTAASSDPADKQREASGSGHFQWQAAGHVRSDQWIIGNFSSIANVAADGVFRVKLGNFPDLMAGNWMGVSVDSERTYGLLICGREEDKALERFFLEQAGHPALPHVPNSILT